MAEPRTVWESTIAGHRFKVVEVPENIQYPFAGFCDDALSVSATRADIAMRALERKHLVGLPEGKLIDFKAAAEALKKRRES